MSNCVHDKATDCQHCFDLANEYVPLVTLSQMVSESYTNAREKGFHSVGQTFGDKMMLAVSELSEALEEYRSGRPIQEIYFVEDKDGNLKPEGVPIEIIDCIIRLCDNLGFYGINAVAAYTLKRDYNRTRSHLHGGKKL